jgi:hypothetical protein
MFPPPCALRQARCACHIWGVLLVPPASTMAGCGWRWLLPVLLVRNSLCCPCGVLVRSVLSGSGSTGRPCRRRRSSMQPGTCSSPSCTRAWRNDRSASLPHLLPLTSYLTPSPRYPVTLSPCHPSAAAIGCLFPMPHSHLVVFVSYVAHLGTSPVQVPYGASPPRHARRLCGGRDPD